MAIVPQRKIALKITPDDDGTALLELLSRRFAYRDAAAWQERIATREILLNAAPTTAATRVQTGDVLAYFPRDIVEPDVDKSFTILFEDEDMLVVEKSGNLPVHPSGIFFQNTLWYCLREKYDFVHLVNRLDRETSGLLLVAKTPRAARLLQKQLPDMHKRYLAIVHGNFTGTVDATGFLVPDSESLIRKKRRFSFNPPGEPARTVLRGVRQANALSLVAAELYSGRMHQIRATLYSLGFPLVGDKLYGLDENWFLRQREDQLSDDDRRQLQLGRQALHCEFLSFRSPLDNRFYEFNAVLPPELAAVMS